MRVVKVQEIESGQTAAANVSNIHGQVILAAGTVMEPRHRTLLKAWGIVEISVTDDAVPPPTAGPPMAPQMAAPQLPPPATEEKRHPALVELAAIAARQAPKGAPADDTNPPDSTGGPSGNKKYRPPWPPVSAETVAGHAKTLVSLPTIYLQVEQAINHPSSSSSDIAKALRTDQGLSARLLRIANSAFYGFPQRVDSVDQAIRIIGTRQLHDLVLATVVLTQFRGVGSNLVTMKSFWQHGFACGIAARLLATFRRESNAERFFVAGLLHDIGSLVLYQEFSQRAAVALEEHRRNKADLDEVERAIIGCDHAQVGAALMTLWKLPESYREVAANHHNPACSRSPSVGTAVVHIADLLVAALGLGSNGEAGLPRFCTEAWDVVALPLSDLDRAAENVVSLIEETLQVFIEE
jgi:HD-like signal output (HDOD) protein